MGLLKRLTGGGEGPSQEELQRQADEEISQMMGLTGPPSDEPPNQATPQEADSSKEPAAK